MTEINFILASGSPRRKELLASLGIKFKIMIPIIDEVPLPYETPIDCARRLSREKAQSVAKDISEKPILILSADTIIAMNSSNNSSNELILSKPIDESHAYEMLMALREKPHKVISGITILLMGDTPIQITTAVVTEVTMRQYSSNEVREYIEKGNPFDKAGGYAIQEKKFNLVQRIKGSYSNVVGLPLEMLIEILNMVGYNMPTYSDS